LRRQCAQALDHQACGILDELQHSAVKRADRKSGPHVRGTHRG
jgi:hypothetical protein